LCNRGVKLLKIRSPAKRSAAFAESLPAQRIGLTFRTAHHYDLERDLSGCNG
jgi:hypothetical protein